jgi:nucleoside-diphosphate-sugar epimerase
MRIYVVGGLGFIGHNIVYHLAKQSEFNKITVIDNIDNYGILDIKEISSLHQERLNKIKHFTNVQIQYKDITDDLDITDANVIIHLAGYPRAKAVNVNPTRAANVMISGTVRLCEIANKCRARMIFISSSMVYGDWKSIKARETDEATPNTLYGLLKLQAEEIVKMLCKHYLIIRPSAVYGPCDVTDRVISKMFENAIQGKDIIVNGADNMLDFTYVDDIARGIVSTVNNVHWNYTVNMSNGQARSLGEAAALIKQITNSNSRIIYKGSDALFPSRGAQDITLSTKLFDFNPRVPLHVGLEELYKWLQTR